MASVQPKRFDGREPPSSEERLAILQDVKLCISKPALKIGDVQAREWHHEVRSVHERLDRGRHQPVFSSLCQGVKEGEQCWCAALLLVGMQRPRERVGTAGKRRVLEQQRLG